MTTLKDLSKGLGNPFKDIEKGTSYSLAQILNQGTYTFALNEEIGVTQVGLWLGDEFIGFFCDGTITFHLASNLNSNDLIIKSLSEDGEVKRVKLEKGAIANKWTPAPEDMPKTDKIRFFKYVKIISKPHEIDDSMLIKKQTIHLDDPSQNTIEVGVEVSSFTDKQLEANNTIKIIKSDYVTNEKMTNVITPMTTQISQILQEAGRIELSVSELTTDVEAIHNGNIMPNFNGEAGYFGWTGNSELIATDDLFADDYLTNTMGFVIKDFDLSLVPRGLSFTNSGSDISPKGSVIPNMEYSYRAKIERFKPFSINVLEYDIERTLIETQTFNFNEDMPFVEFTTELDPQTRFVSLEFVRENVTYLDRLEITEQMFNRGLPKTYFENAEDVRVWTESQIQVLNNEITLNASEIDAVSGSIHNAGVEINAQEGVTTRGKKFKVLSEDGTETYMEVTEEGVESHKMTAIDMVAENATVTGTINAIRGEIGNFNIQNGVLEYISQTFYKVYTGADAANLTSILRGQKIATPYDMFVLDVNDDGVLDVVDAAMIQAAIRGIAPIYTPVKSKIMIGTTSGEISSNIIYDGDKIGPSFIMQAEELRGLNASITNASIEEMNFKGQNIIIDENGFLKVV